MLLSPLRLVSYEGLEEDKAKESLKFLWGATPLTGAFRNTAFLTLFEDYAHQRAQSTKFST